jgi:mannose-6-phosphate isomerase-like protein (cupin superfamily)
VTGGDDQIRIVDASAGPSLAIVQGDGSATAVIWPGMGARLRSLHVIELGADARTVPLSHPSEAVYCVTAGSGQVVDPDTHDGQPLREGSMVHLEIGTPYAFRAGPDGMSLVGGPSPPDPALYEHLL